MTNFFYQQFKNDFRNKIIFGNFNAKIVFSQLIILKVIKIVKSYFKFLIIFLKQKSSKICLKNNIIIK